MAYTEFIPDINFAGVSSALAWFFILMIVAGVMGALAFLLIQHLRYRYKVVVFENLSGQGYVPTKKDKASLIRIGDGGAEVLYLRRNKTYKNAYGKKMGKNTYWFGIGEDGYWYNITIGDLDEKLKSLDVKPVDRDMRYMQVALQRNVRERFDKAGFWQKYGGIVMYISLIAVTGIMMYLLFDKWMSVSGALTSAIEAAKEVLEVSKDVLGAADNLQTSGGLKPA